MELRPWLLWVVAAAGPLVLLVADAHGQEVFTNTWAVHISGGPAVADRLARKHGFLNQGQVGVLTPAGLGLRHLGGGLVRTGVLALGAGTMVLVFSGTYSGGSGCGLPCPWALA